MGVERIVGTHLKLSLVYAHSNYAVYKTAVGANQIKFLVLCLDLLLLRRCFSHVF